MTLPASGSISMSQVRTELGGSGALDLNNTSVRSLAGVSSGKISMSQLRGKSKGTTKILTTGGSYDGETGVSVYGYATSSWGSISPDDTYNGTYIFDLYWYSSSSESFIHFYLIKQVAQSFFTSLTIDGVTYYTGNAAFGSSSNLAVWVWTNVNTNPFGAVGSQHTILIS